MPVALTSGPKQHWFGYYDKWQSDPSGRYLLGGQVELFYRSPTARDVLRVGLIDLEDGNRWMEIGTSTSWSWQQGCMLQWVPGSQGQIIWNDHAAGRFVSKVYNLQTRKTRILPHPIYTLSPDGKTALFVDPGRLQFFRPGYGYPQLNPSLTWERAPKDTGVFKMDLQSGESTLILSFQEVAQVSRAAGSVADNFHWLNHLLINPSGDRFIFLNRSRPKASLTEMRAYVKAHPELQGTGFSSNYVTRAMTANLDGTELYTLNDSGMFSHFIWNGNDRICAWAVPEDQNTAGFFDFRDRSKEYVPVGSAVMTRNGHNTYVPHTDHQWILNDTYPQGPERLQELYLYHVPSGDKVVLGHFHQPAAFTGEWRCDLHPRCNQTGTKVFFDSTHMGGKRQMYMIDIEDIVRK
ncbi:MAG: hypothetical protein KTR24_11525 [Saprospiraceae bacterium]|nr:hypothetical protein [Saprospiraceae bacterium]